MRVESGTPGFDDVLGGGLLAGQPAVVSGGPGTGKTVLALQFLAAGGTGLHIGFEEQESELRRNASALGIDLSGVEVLDLSPSGEEFFADDAYAVFPSEEVEGEDLLEQITTTLAEAGPDDNPLVYVNEAFVELTGYSIEEKRGEDCRFLQGEHTDSESVAAIRRALDAEEPVSVVLRNYRADGTEFWNSLDISPVRNDEGEVTNYIGFQQDVTDRVEYRRQLRLLDQYLRHNLRNRLNVVQGTAAMIQAEGEPPMPEYAARIEAASGTLLGKMEKERAVMALLDDDPATETVDVASLIRSIAADLEETYPDAAISVSAPESVSVRAVANVATAFRELIENGIEHGDDSPRVAVELVPEGDSVRIRVADDGPGIPEVESNVLTGAREETDVYHGQGLGLWLVYLVVQHSEGQIEFGDDDAEGGVVTVVLQRAGAA